MALSATLSFSKYLSKASVGSFLDFFFLTLNGSSVSAINFHRSKLSKQTVLIRKKSLRSSCSKAKKSILQIENHCNFQLFIACTPTHIAQNAIVISDNICHFAIRLSLSLSFSLTPTEQGGHTML